MTLGAYFHDLNPVVLWLGKDWAVRWYGLSYVAGFAICWLFMFWAARRRLIALRPDRVDVALVAIVLGVLVGGRLVYAIAYDPALLTGFSNSFPFWDLLAINKGGMASHGGMIGAIIGCWLVSREARRPQGALAGQGAMLHIMDIVALAAPFGLFLGRIANFINGELLGRIVTPPGPRGGGPAWTVQFPQELKGWRQPPPALPEGHAPMLDDSQQQALVGLVRSVAQPGDTWAEARDKLIQHAGEHKDALSPLLSSRHPSQIYQAIAEGLVLGLIVWFVWRRPRKPGVVAGVWLVVYGVLRIVTEIWRLPDAQFAQGRPMGLSRGQWFSAAMVACGVVLVWWAGRRAVEAIGGWQVRAPIPPKEYPA